MSTWYEVEADDIDVDHHDKEVSFFVCNDDQGRVYLTLSFDQIKEIAARIGMPNSVFSGAPSGASAGKQG